MTPERFVAESALDVSAASAFDWHDRPGALERLTPPWERVRIVSPGHGIRDGSTVELEVAFGPLRRHWLARHDACLPGRQFRDVSVRGPFPRWEHVHEFIPVSTNRCLLRDSLSYRLPGGKIGGLLGARLVRRKLSRLFRYRHDVTRQDLAMLARLKDPTPLTIAVSGASGLVGTALTALLTTAGHRVLKLVRRAAQSPDELQWDAKAGLHQPERLADVDALVLLAGENIAAGRWTPDVMERIRSSRVDAVRANVRSLARLQPRPRALVSASAIGYYGDRGDELLTESSPPGKGFLADTAVAWEREALAARDLNMRVAVLRIGVVLSPRGGALAKLLPLFSLGLGGPVGSGRQFMSWISIDDVIGAIHHVVTDPDLHGPINVVAPNPVTSAEFAATLGRVLHRPAVLPAPAAALRLMLGQMAEETVLASTRVAPEILLRSRYAFRHDTLEAALRHVLGRHNPDTVTP